MNIIFNRIEKKGAFVPPQKNVAIAEFIVSFSEKKIKSIKVVRYFAPKGEHPRDINVDVRFAFINKNTGSVHYDFMSMLISAEAMPLDVDIFNKTFDVAINTSFKQEILDKFNDDSYTFDDFKIEDVYEH